MRPSTIMLRAAILLGIALADYLERQARRAALEENTLSQLGPRRADPLVESRSNSCGEPTTCALSRVGRDLAKTHAEPPGRT